MKITSATLLASVLLLNIVGASLRAQPEALEAETNKATAAAPKNDATQSRDDSVRIDGTGIHVGGEQPVDISVPDWGSRIGPLLPIISVLAVFGSPVAILGLFFYFRHRRNRMLHETLRAMIEKGVPIPPELLSGGGAALANGASIARRGINDLRNGLILIGVGVGVIALGQKAGFSRLGIIPVLIGVAMIGAWLIGNKMRNKQTPP